MGNRLPGNPIEIRNLLAENDIYQLFEFTSLRQLVLIVREVTSKDAVFIDIWRHISRFSDRDL